MYFRLSNSSKDIKTFKKITRRVIGILLGIYLIALILLNIPAVQSRMSVIIAHQLSEFLETEVHIGNVNMGLLNRVIIDDILIKDQQKDTLLRATRLSAKMEILALLQGKIVINNSQLFGCYLNVYQNQPQEKTNMQFLIDAFAQNDSLRKEKNIDLRINSILIRRGEVLYNKRYQAETPGKFNPNHIHIKQLSTNISLKAFRNDSLNLQLKRLSFKEQSGLNIDQIRFKLLANTKGANLTDFMIKMPESQFTIDSLACTYPDSPKELGWSKWFQELKGQIDIQEAQIALNDLSCFVPGFKEINEPLLLTVKGKLDNRNIDIEQFKIHTEGEELYVESQLFLYNPGQSKRFIHASDLKIDLEHSIFNLLPEQLQKKLEQVQPYARRADFLAFRGDAEMKDSLIQAKGEIRSNCGKILIDGTFYNKHHFKGSLATPSFNLGRLMPPDNKFGKLAFNLNLNGNIANPKVPVIRAKGTIREFDFKGYTYQNIKIDGNYNYRGFEGNIAMNDPNGTIEINGSMNPYLKNPKFDLSILLDSFSPNKLKLTDKQENIGYSAWIQADFSGMDADNMDGSIIVNQLVVNKEGTIHEFGDISLISQKEGNHQDIRLQSNFAQANISGNFTFKSLIDNIKSSATAYLPNVVKAQNKQPAPCDLQANFHIQNLDLLKLILDLPLDLKQAVYLNAIYNSKDNLLQLSASAPHLVYGKENLKSILLQYTGSNGYLNGSIHLKREMNRKMVNFDLYTDIKDGIINNNFYWSIPKNDRYKGKVSISTRFEEDEKGEKRTILNLNPSQMTINDSLWTIHPSEVTIAQKRILVDHFYLDQSDERYLKVNGLISESETDTLMADLKDINLQYIFNMINFHAVEFDGYATGKVKAYQLFKDPTIEAKIRVKDFTFNWGEMGSLDAYARWNKTERAIALDAVINDVEQNSTTSVKGTITPGKDERSGINLYIDAKNTNLFFLNHYTAGIFTDMQGRVSGNLRVYGPFQQIDLNGDMRVNHASLKVDVLNTYYHMMNNEVKIRPGKIIFSDAIIYDQYGYPSSKDHYAIVNGTLMHQHFTNMSYDIGIRTNNILGYNQESFGDELFCGTAFATGDVRIKGYPGTLNVDLNATPERNTVFTYNLSRPDVLTESQFIKFVDRTPEKKDPLLSWREEDTEEETTPLSTPVEPADIHVNFNLNINPNAEIKILMDARAGDYISARGSGNIKASFYNKGNFQMYGTFRVQDGIYKLSLQDVIRKDFNFTPGGTIVFGGNPNEAALNLQAVYTVPSVSLNDLASGSTFSQTNARVNCLMNIQGKAQQPQLHFDFDILNVNEDEKEMVKSLISTEEEKNMQIIYLLGIGRFYTYDYSNPDQSQSSVAMKSLLSSTLSGQLNQMLSNIVGNNNWNIGTNLSTGEQGWSDMDVEGLLSGRLLNNRLLINGNFGYRDNTNTYNSSNFIGDFDIQWLLTPSGNVSLKAYSETNDRYFTKSSLTTQGIGLQLKRDFSSWKDLFMTQKKRKRLENQQKAVETEE